MSTMTKEDGVWVFRPTDTTAHTLDTLNKYLDANIKVQVSAGTLSAGAGSASLSGNSNVELTTTDTYNNGLSIQASGAGTVSVGTSGWLSSGSSQSSGTATSTKYLKGVTLTKPSTGTNQFYIQVPNGSGQIKFVFNVDTSGNVTISEE